MADIWKTEFHLLPPGSQDAEEYFDDRDQAIAAATEKGQGWQVQEVTSYIDDRRIIFPADDEGSEW